MISETGLHCAVLMCEMAKRLDDERLQEVIDLCDEQSRASGAVDITQRFYATNRDALAQFLADREPT